MVDLSVGTLQVDIGQEGDPVGVDERQQGLYVPFVRVKASSEGCQRGGSAQAVLKEIIRPVIGIFLSRLVTQRQLHRATREINNLCRNVGLEYLLHNFGVFKALSRDVIDCRRVSNDPKNIQGHAVRVATGTDDVTATIHNSIQGLKIIFLN